MYKQKNICFICFMSVFIMALSYMLVACDNQNKNCNHTGGNATCTQQAVCEICNQPYGELAPHDFTIIQHDSSYHWKKCQYCDATSSKESHTGGNAVCTQQAVCEICHQPYGELAPHDFTVIQHDSSYHWKKCQYCDAMSSKESHTGGNATCTQQAVCEICNQPYGELAPHAYADNYTCHDRKCINKDCFHIEYATTEHTIEKYACIYCKTSIGCSLEILQRDYETILVEKVKNFGYGEAIYSVVILNQNETLKNLANYHFSEQLDKTKITRGLFVKMEPFNGNTMYYNFGLELSVEQQEDILVSTGKPEDPWFDEWYLEVVDGNKKLLFEFPE